MLALLLLLTSFAFAGTNNLGVEHAGTIQLAHINKFQTALAGDFVPRDTLGNVNDGVDNLGEAIDRWNSIYTKKYSLIGTTGGNTASLAGNPAAVSSYNLTFPSALPITLQNLQVDTLGNLYYGTGTTSPFVTSASSGTFSVHPGINVTQAVPNLSVTITTTGRPVLVLCMGDGSFNAPSTWGGSYFQTPNAPGAVLIYRDGVAIKTFAMPNAEPIPSSAISTLDFTASAGSHTYAIYMQTGSSGTPFIESWYTVLTAYEE